MFANIHPVLAHPWVNTTILIGLLLIAGLFSNFVVKKSLLRLVNKLLENTSFGRDQELRKHGVIPRLANVMPALVISAGVQLLPGIPQAVAEGITNASNAFIILTLSMAVSGVLSIVDTIYHRDHERRAKPIKSYLQILKIAIYAVATILVIATLVDRSPVILLSGLGAMAAVLILVFQDTLLSFVAAVQILFNNMVEPGDWIEMPSENADGEVIDLSLHTAKIQNWDKTIQNIPIRKFVTQSFKNWRGMQESGGRRIKRSVNLDQNSVRFLSNEEIQGLKNISLISSYLTEKEAELDGWNVALGHASNDERNTRRLTNIGTFRAYMKAYLELHPRIRQDMTLLVRQRDPSSHGIPIEFYAFTATTAWAEYEDIQSDIFDHILSVLPVFDLEVYQEVGSRDIRISQCTNGLVRQLGAHLHGMQEVIDSVPTGSTNASCQ